MKYTVRNVIAGTTVYDVDLKEELQQVVSVDDSAGEVCLHKPIKLENGEFLCYTLKFRSVYPIYGGEHAPVMFHCYGRHA